MTNNSKAGCHSDFLPCTVVTHCRSVPASTTYQRHPVTINPDWSVDTGHDLQGERVATALGGYNSCLDLAETTVPAARQWLRLQLREDLPALVTRTGLVWRPRQQAMCCPATGFRDPVKAAEHVRSEAHLAAVFDASRAQLSVVLRQWSGRLQNMSSHRRVTWKLGLTPDVVGELQSLLGRPLPADRRLLAMVATHLKGADLQAGVPRGIAAVALWCHRPADLRYLAGDGSDRVGELCRSLLSWHHAGMALRLDELLLLLSPKGCLLPAPSDRALRTAQQYETVGGLSRKGAAVAFARLGGWAPADETLNRARKRRGPRLNELRWIQWAVEMAA